MQGCLCAYANSNVSIQSVAVAGSITYKQAGEARIRTEFVCLCAHSLGCWRRSMGYL